MAPFTLLLLSLIVAEITGPFFQVWQEGARSQPVYQRLFFHAWNNPLVTALGVAFAAALWTVLGLFAVLFGLIEV